MPIKRRSHSPTFLPAILTLFALSACGDDYSAPDTSPYVCVKPEVLAAPDQQPAFQYGPLYVAHDVLWRTPEIPVCWEARTYDIQSDADRAIVQQAVTESWETALNFDLVPIEKRVHFVGWEKCNESNQSGIRIWVPYGSEDLERSYVGTNIAGRPNGMQLNFDFTAGPSRFHCQYPENNRQRCIYKTAVHEFGHALGFKHEQVRPDTNLADCEAYPSIKSVPDKTSGTLMGPWDLESVMNYCNPRRSNGGVLSEGDLLGVKAAYYPELYDFACIGRWRERRAVLKNFGTD